MTLYVAQGALQVPQSAFQGKPGAIYKFMAGPIQNAGGPSFFQPITVSNHDPTFMDSVVTTTGTTGTITINYDSLGAIDVVSFWVVPDETFVINGVDAGASVGLTSAVINTSKNGAQTDPSLLNTTTYPNSNLWVGGIFRTS